ncbi:phosphatidylinositol-glycan biosynthesis class F protein-like [Lineus longissimus]|uniref:phosphatidylinositol-glycan biosynthesis class F protein-like n=1 Tax=Lineus longissimus TaxID=88925 RepID=UPI00315C9FFC
MAPPMEIGNSTFLRKKGTKLTILANIIQIFLILATSLLSLQSSTSSVVPSFTEKSHSATKTFIAFTALFNALHATVYFYYEKSDVDSQRPGPRNRGLVQFVTTKLKHIVRAAVLLFISTLIFHCIAILFGAPLIVGVSETYHFSLMLTATTVFPACLTLGTNAEEWLKVFIHKKPGNILEKQLLITFWCSIIGAWLGAFPIPLDWDRPWQEWPISCVLGTLFGYVTGLLGSSFYLAWLQRRQKTKSF